jgi:hypothetical protein
MVAAVVEMLRDEVAAAELRRRAAQRVHPRARRAVQVRAWVVGVPEKKAAVPSAAVWHQ